MQLCLSFNSDDSKDRVLKYFWGEFEFADYKVETLAASNKELLERGWVTCFS